ncbi:MAG TPA: hypothetical protein VFO51_09860 [Sphingomicrobium sp.]|nr:hypothetical protein [Sphingomicrobium sp.]
MPGYDECLVEAELRARAAYAEPHRHYHDERHLDECLADLDGVPGLSERDRRLLRWAILWHEVIHEPGRPDNEDRSAKIAEAELARCGAPAEETAEVARLIRLTKGHRVDAGDRLGALMASIDLAVLGAGPDRYRLYAESVRREYLHLSDGEWRQGRALVLMNLLANDPLYPDPGFRERLESRARRNMGAEIRALREG